MPTPSSPSCTACSTSRCRASGGCIACTRSRRACSGWARAYFERRRGELRPGLELDTAAFVVVQTIEALTHGAMIHGDAAPPRDALVDEVTTLVLRYLAP